MRTLLRLASHAEGQVEVDPLLTQGHTLAVKIVAAVLNEPA